MILKVEIAGYVAPVESFARFDDPVENERAASAHFSAQLQKSKDFGLLLAKGELL